MLAGLLLAWQPAAWPQADFQIVWVVVGEAAAASGEDQTGAGRRLFMASELADFALRRVNVARIDAQPVISELNIGERVCITSMKIVAYDAKGATIKQAPLSISIRQDHKESIGSRAARPTFAWSRMLRVNTRCALRACCRRRMGRCEERRFS